VNQDTIFALSSGRPPAAVSVIRISGPQAHSAAAAIAGGLPEARTAAVRELRDPDTGDRLDQALVLRFDAPASSTGEDIVEYQCHGGRAVVDAVLAALGRIEGLRAAQPGEFTRRAFENGRIDLTEAEGLADLIEAETESQRKAALALAEGGLRRQIEAWQERLLLLSAVAERAIDYDEEDEPLDPALAKGCADLAEELRDWLERPRAERLKDGLRVVIAGPPNSGKSSLINALAQEERAIVTAIPGTTRDHIEVPLALGGVPIILTDTAGLRETDDPVESIGVHRAAALAEAADILLWMGEARDAPAHPRLIQLYGKCDLPARAEAPTSGIPISSITGAGLAALARTISGCAVALLPAEGIVALNRRQAELLGEAELAIRRAAAGSDPVLLAEDLRVTRSVFDRLTGRAGVEDVLDALFGRFCLGK